MITTNATVFIVDDDAAMRDSLSDLIRSVGLRVELFDSAQDFLRSERPDLPGCLLATLAPIILRANQEEAAGFGGA